MEIEVQHEVPRVTSSEGNRIQSDERDDRGKALHKESHTLHEEEGMHRKEVKSISRKNLSRVKRIQQGRVNKLLEV